MKINFLPEHGVDFFHDGLFRTLVMADGGDSSVSLRDERKWWNKFKLISGDAAGGAGDAGGAVGARRRSVIERLHGAKQRTLVYL